jgi:CDP-diacylglycerol--serine O-phosphatidyltransferase
MRSPVAVLHPSNLLTYVSLTAGVCSVAAALSGSAPAAGACLAAAALSDTFDGRFARRFTRSRQLEAAGVELDSLVDAVTFGASPIAAVAILSTRAGAAAPWWWWVAAVGYVASAMTRLAYYNVAHADDGPQFVGLPTPVAALVWSTLLLASGGWTTMAIAAAALAAAMIAPLRIVRPAGGGLTLFALWPVALIATHLARLHS